jgi:alpha-L-rhamnosidase
MLLKYLVEDAERADLLFPILTRTNYPGYGYFLKSGETTWPEYWKIEGEPSRIHTCYTGIAGYFIKAIGGIRPDPTACGMQRFIIKPQLVGDLTFARATSGTLYGKIVCNWSRHGNTATFEIEVPPNTTATVFIPATSQAEVREGNGPAAAAAGVRALGREGDSAAFLVSSGVYRFYSSALP